MWAFRDKPDEGEAFTSYLARLSYGNGLSVERFIARLKKSHRVYGISNAPDIIKAKRSNLYSVLADGVQADESIILDALIPRRVGELGCSGSASRVIRKTPRFCPLCCFEFRWFRKVWYVDVVEVCSIHRCLLRDDCAECGAQVDIYARHEQRWNSECYCYCCGDDLADAPTEPVGWIDDDLYHFHDALIEAVISSPRNTIHFKSRQLLDNLRYNKRLQKMIESQSAGHSFGFNLKDRYWRLTAFEWLYYLSR